jgi:hypothetical protein
MISVICKACLQQIQVADTTQGSIVTCPGCGRAVPVAATRGKVPPPLPAAAEINRHAYRAADGGQGEGAARPPRLQRDGNPRAETSRQKAPPVEAAEAQGFFDDLPRDLPVGVERLGYPTAVYRGKISGPVTGIVFGSLLAGGGVVAVMTALVFLIRANGRAEMGGPVVVSLIAMGCIPLGISLIFLCLNNLRLRVGVFTDGLLYCKGQRVEMLRWDEIKSVLQCIVKQFVNGVYTGTLYRYTLEHEDGSRLVLTTRIQHIETLGAAIQQEITRRKLPAAVQGYDLGQPVKFGKLVVENEGMRYNDAFLPWEDIDEVKVDKGVVMVRKKGKWLNWKNVSVALIPNFFVFLALVDRVVGIKRK